MTKQAIYQFMEAQCHTARMMGYKLKLWSVEDGHCWQWKGPNGISEIGHTSAHTKGVALWCALQAIF